MKKDSNQIEILDTNNGVVSAPASQSVVDLLLNRSRERKVGTVSFSPTPAISGAMNRYFVNRADRSDLINKALAAYFVASGAVLHPDGRIEVLAKKQIDFEVNDRPQMIDDLTQLSSPAKA